jgi:hypothetical protein
MKLLCRLFGIDQIAADSSRIPRDVVEDYLRSKEYEVIRSNKTATGGITHINRSLTTDPSMNLKGVVGRDDLLLIKSEITHVLTDIFIDGNDVMGVLEILDESLMDTKSAERIKQLKGLVRNGIKVGLSCVILAYWDQNEVATGIKAIKGVDITENPSFAGSGVVRIIEDESTKGESV